jgi:DNA-binding winged helix-turn-helix (wHTH) protein
MLGVTQKAISPLRKVLGRRAIATVPGRGYRFTAGRGRRDGPTR